MPAERARSVPIPNRPPMLTPSSHHSTCNLAIIDRTDCMNRWTPLAVASALSAVAIYAPAPANADTCSDAATAAPLPIEVGPCADVLAQEGRWLGAITAGDVAT